MKINSITASLRWNVSSKTALPRTNQVNTLDTIKVEAVLLQSLNIPNILSSPKRNLTSKILEDSSQVYGRSHTDAILGQSPFDVAQHASHGEDDPGLGGPGRLCRLLLSPSAGHRAEIASLSGSAMKQPGSTE